MSDGEILLTALTPEEKNHCQNLVVYGIEYLRTALDWNAKATRRFLERVEVQRELKLLKEQYQDRDAIQARTQFFAQLKINQMVPHALTILVKALRGTVTDADGKATAFPPERVQYDAALEVLNRANIQGAKFAPGSQVPSIDARSLHLHADGGTGTKARIKDLDPKQRARVTQFVSRITSGIRAVADADRLVAERAPLPATELPRRGGWVDGKWDATAPPTPEAIGEHAVAMEDAEVEVDDRDRE